MSGIAFGRTENIDPADSQMFRDSGLWHLLAASGQNIALVVALCIAAARALRAGRWLGLVWALAAIPAYVLIVGGGASIVRAGLMGELVVVAWLAGRLADVRHLLLVSAVVLVWAWPGSWQSLGFQLSYACVIGLLVWASHCTKWLRSLGLPHILAEGTAATVICTLTTAPLLMATVGSSPLLGGIANLIAVPLASLVLVVALPAALLEPILPSISHLGLAAAGYAAQLLLSVAHIAVALPGARTTSPLVGYVVPALCLVFAERQRLPVVRHWCASTVGAHARRAALRAGMEDTCRVSLRYCVAISLGCCLVAVGVRVVVAEPAVASGGRGQPRGSTEKATGAAPGSVTNPHAALGTVTDPHAAPGSATSTSTETDIAAGARVIVFDVGQGQSVLVADGKRGILLDAGPPGVDTARMTRAAGVDQLEGVVLTHDARDHIGGFPSLAASLHPPWVGEPATGPDVHVADDLHATNPTRLCAGARASFAAITLEVVNPPCDHPGLGDGSDPHNDSA
ncbi:MAG: ComEC/Rec2 family competence protein, partial [Thermoleophilia bacterium]|nr:ComEC/Rec2 family competence protein [Thermoleophilia bacterium]